MDTAPSLLVACFVMILVATVPSYNAQLALDFYNQVCPEALPTIRMIVEQAIAQEPRMGASLLRLHFHDCFVNGCDGSILLDDKPGFIGEKTATPNNNSARGFDVIDKIKATVNSVCRNNVVSCADILAVAARDSVSILGGPYYLVPLGRRDSRTASRDAANNNIPSPFLDFPALLRNFQNHGLNLKDLVVLSGGHTLGLARCVLFRSRLYNETSAIEASFASSLKARCPISGGDNNFSPLDSSPVSFDTVYFQSLVQKKGLLHSDQQLFKGDGSGGDALVKFYVQSPGAFWEDFGKSMVKMGNLKSLTVNNGEIRKNCRSVN